MRKTCQQHFEKKINFFSGGGKTTCSWRERPGKIAEFRDGLQTRENALQRVRFPETHDYAIFAFRRAYGPLNGLRGLPGGGTSAREFPGRRERGGISGKTHGIPVPPQTHENALQRPRKGSDVKLLKKSF